MNTDIEVFLYTLSLNSQRTYRHALKHYIIIMRKIGVECTDAEPLLNASPQNTIEYVAELIKRGVSRGTVYRSIKIMCRLYDICMGRSPALINPFRDNRLYRYQRLTGVRPTEILKFELVMRFINAPGGHTHEARRDRAILATLFGGALRVSEVVKLRIGDFKHTQSGIPYLQLRETKSGDSPQQAIARWAGEFLGDFVKERIASGARPDDPIFLNGWLKAMNLRHVQRIFREIREKLGIADRITPHSARATAITKLLSNPKITHGDVMRFARHTTIQMTEVYNKRRLTLEEAPIDSLDF